MGAKGHWPIHLLIHLLTAGCASEQTKKNDLALQSENAAIRLSSISSELWLWLWRQLWLWQINLWIKMVIHIERWYNRSSALNKSSHQKKSLSRLIEPHSTLLISNSDLLSFRSIANSYDLISCPWPPHDEAHFRNAAQGHSLIVAKSALTRPFCALGSNDPVKIVNIVNINTNPL